MHYLKKLYRSLSLPNILKTLFVLSWLVILIGCGQVSFSRGAGSLELKGNELSSTGQSYKYPVSFLNDRARDITGAAAVNAPGFVVPGGLTGAGQIVAVADSGLDAGSMDDIHPDLKSEPGKMPKVVLLKSWADRDVPDDPDGHGTHMAAAIAGTGAASNGKFRGIAPGASIYFQAILNSAGNPEPPANLADLFYPAYSAGARVHVNGWGGGPDAYLEPASQVDDFVRDYPDFLAVFGAGNSGPLTGTITGEANSKNALAVGASTLPRPAFTPGEGETTEPAEFSSRGPAGDGRIKPELLAPASAVISARSRLVEGNLPGYQDYTRLQGTSMAAAVAGGSSALVREYFKKYMDITTPSAALVKAALVNGARPAAGGPSRDGFGTIDLAGTIIALKESTFSVKDEWSGLAQGEGITYTYHVSDPAGPFKATLAWTDPPAEPGSAKALVNDLDLVVRAPGGKIYYGNHFLGFNTPDRTNNIEQVYLPSPELGDYTVTVTGTAVRRNTVQGASVLLQDFALVWGQAPAGGTVNSADGGSVKLTDGSSFNIADISVVNLVNDNIAPADGAHLFDGAAVFKTPGRVYLASRLWREIGIKALKTLEGTILTEINPAARLGGYRLAHDNGEIMLNKSPALPVNMPPGVEISAVINPHDQKLWQVQAVYTELTGVVSEIREEKGNKTLYLAGGGAFRIAPEAAYSYEDSYANSDKEDTPFGTGALEQLEDVLPGMPVLLHLSPSSGQIQYLAVKRRVALGTVSEVNKPGGEILLENGARYKILPGAPVKRDGQSGSFEEVLPGDHITAVILPDTGEAIGLVVFSSVLYGKAIDFTKKSEVIYFIDDDGLYRSLCLAKDAIIYRWGVRTTADAIAAGSLIRVTTDPEGKVVRQLDIAETVYDKGILKYLDESAGVLSTLGGIQYGISGTTRFYKNNYPVTPDDLRSGEYVELEYTTAPEPTGNVLVSANASSVAMPPVFQVSVIPLGERVVVTGKAGPNTTVHIWAGNSCQQATVDDSGRFRTTLSPEGQKSSLTLVALDRRTGGVTGEQMSLLKDGWSVKNENISLTRAEAADMLARMLGWSKCSDWPLTFTDKEEIPASYRPAVAEACARGIFKGYPDGSFRPLETLSRAEAALLFAAVLRDLGLDIKANAAVPYSDAGEIPPWAASAAAEADAAGLFPERRGGAFGPGEQVTRGEIAAVSERLLKYCEKQL